MRQDEFTKKIEDLATKGLTGSKILEAVLRGQSLLEICRFTIDLNLPDALLPVWINALTLDSPAKELVRRALQSGIPDELADVLSKSKIDEQGLRNSLAFLADGRKPMEIVHALLDTDLNPFEIYSCLSGAPNLSERLKNLSDLLEKFSSASEIMKQYGKQMSLSDQLMLCYALDLKDAELKEIAKQASFDVKFFQTLSPGRLVDKIKNPALFTKTFLAQLDQVSKEDFGETLRSREYAQSHWFQTVGPNVLHTFSGILSKGIPSHSGKKKIFPDFQLVLYRDQTARAHQIGPDGLLSTPEESRNIIHAYEGEVNDQTVSLTECSAYEANEKRPSLGPLQLKDFQINPSGLEASFQWMGKNVTLHWDPGF